MPVMIFYKPIRRAEGILGLLVIVLFYIYLCVQKPSVALNPYMILGFIFFAGLCIYYITQPLGNPLVLNEISKALEQDGAFQVKEGEKVLKKGEVWYMTSAMGVLYLTNQRLFAEYSFVGMHTRNIEIALKEITNVERSSHTGRYGIQDLKVGQYEVPDLKVEYQHLGKPGTIVFSDRFETSGAVVDEWIAQIQKAAKLGVNKPKKA